MEDKIKFQAKKDKYFKARGGTTQFYYLFCSACGKYVALYQKDGPGDLLRLYLDRIFEPKELTLLQNEIEKSKLPPLRCRKCDTVIGVPMVYEKEKRLAFRLIRGLLRKEKCNGLHYTDNQAGEPL